MMAAHRVNIREVFDFYWQIGWVVLCWVLALHG